MRPRQDIIDIFSTFVQFNADRFDGWVVEPKLRRSMQKSLARSPQAHPAEFWVIYWYNLWLNQSPSYAREHLAAYLQEACYWVAYNTITSFSSTQYSLADCFQIAIARLDKILKGFDSQQGFNLKNYASAIFASTIKETLRQRQEVDICTDWSLLRKLSTKRLTAALQNVGLSAAKINKYIMAWNCFKTVYVPTQVSLTRQLTQPNRETWEAIAKLYNTQQQTTVCCADLEKWMITCADAARAYLYPTLISINTPYPASNGEWLDHLPQQESLLTDLITQEEIIHRRSQQTQMNAVLTTVLREFDAQTQQLLQLYYSENLTQQQIANQLEIKQYTISRRLSKCRETLLKALAQWSQETLHISLNSDVINNISAVLDEWLQGYYHHDK